MSQNQAPIFPKTPINSWTAPLTLANTTVNGDLSIGNPAILLFTANASTGSRLDYIRVRALGTNVATVLRVFVNNGSTIATAANSSLFTEVTIAATTLIQTAALAETTLQLDLVLQAGYKIYLTIGTAVSAGLVVAAFGGDY